MTGRAQGWVGPTEAPSPPPSRGRDHSGVTTETLHINKISVLSSAVPGSGETPTNRVTSRPRRSGRYWFPRHRSYVRPSPRGREGPTVMSKPL